ncbi:MAG: hypothetical protein PVG38_13730 [Gammaproteobacteria bacterium]
MGHWTEADGYCLLPLTSPASLRERGLDHVVMLVPASLQATRTAYRRIKLLCAQGTPHIGIVIVGPRDQHAAWEYFRKLAVGALRYLDVPLLNLGFLPQVVTSAKTSESRVAHSFLARIGERLLHRQFYTLSTLNTVKNLT